jgi:hypothetical protein
MSTGADAEKYCRRGKNTNLRREWSPLACLQESNRVPRQAIFGVRCLIF